MERYFLLSEKDLPPKPVDTIPAGNATKFPPFPPVRKSPVDSLVQKIDLDGTHSSDKLWHLYSDLLARYRALQRSNTVIPTPQLLSTIEEPSESIDEGVRPELFKYAIETLPKGMKKKGQHILTIFQKTSPGIFSLNGQLVDDKTNQEIAGSNLIDLLHYLLREGRTRVPPPVGWDIFARMVKENPSIPQNSFKRLRSVADESSDNSESEVHFETPQKYKKTWSPHPLSQPQL